MKEFCPRLAPPSGCGGLASSTFQAAASRFGMRRVRSLFYTTARFTTFEELRAELESAGHSFRTKSDTEVIVHAYEAWGEDCPKRFHGMFAFSIVEMPRGATGPATKIFLARDPMGIKPLYYADADGVFFFASEVRALLASGQIAPRIAVQTLPAYLLFGSVGEPATLIENVRSLPPGHSISIPVADRISATPVPKAYWDPASEFRTFSSAKQNGASRDTQNVAPSVAVRTLLENSVRGHLIADVPIGVFLSSGIDSTALAAIASGMQRDIHTFTVAFPDAEYNEAGIAQRTAARLGTEHTEFTLSLADMVSRLDEAVAAFDQPSMDGVNSYFVSWAARQAGLKVALSGLGSDELFGGYTAFRATSKIARVAGLAPFVPRPARAALLRAASSTTQFGLQPDAFRKATAAWLDPAAFPDPYFFTRLLFAPERVAAALHEPLSNWAAATWSEWLAINAAQAAPLDSFTQISWLELRSYMTSTLLRDTDAMSMASSLEVRIPFLDIPLVKYVLSLPESAKRDGAQPKSLLDRRSRRPVAAGNRLAKETHVHIPLGNLAARKSRRACKRRPRGLVTRARATSFSKFRGGNLEGISSGTHHVVAPVEPLCAE